MSNYICMDCGHRFDEPLVEDCGFVHAFGYRQAWSDVCPACGSGEYVPASYCPKCGEEMPSTLSLCNACSAALLDKINAFFDELTEEEEDRFDDWMDGNSIKSRRRWAV